VETNHLTGYIDLCGRAEHIVAGAQQGALPVIGFLGAGSVDIWALYMICLSCRGVASTKSRSNVFMMT
jgi:hypothetical protein